MDDSQKTASDFRDMITTVADTYGKTLSPGVIRVYFEALKRFSLEDVKIALNAHIQSPDDAGKFMPKPADLIQLLQGNSQTAALQAWTKVEKTIRCVGSYRSVVFDDPTIHAVIEEMGGWISLCDTKTEHDLKFKAKEFETRYRAFSLRGGAPNFLPRLKGREEHDCDRLGHDTPAPFLIGDERKAALVAAQGNAQGRLTYTAGDKSAELIQRATLAVAEHKQKALSHG